MNTKTSTAVKAVPNTKPQKTAKPRAPRKDPMTMAQKFDLMTMVKGANPTTPDAALAVLATTALGRPVLQQTVAEYRKSFGLASVRKPSAAQMAARIAQLESLLLSSGIDLPAPTASADGSADAAGSVGTALAA